LEINNKMKRNNFIILGVVVGMLMIHISGVYGAPLKEDNQEQGSVSETIVNWDDIKILDLETAQQIALEQNPTIDASLARLKQAKEIVRQAHAAYLPRLDASATASRVWMSEKNYDNSLSTARLMNPGATVDDPKDYYGAGLTASWVVFDGFERKFNKAAALFSEKQSEAALKDAKRLLLSSVAMSYFSLQLALESIEIAKADAVFYERQLTEAKARRQVGTGSLSEELNFEVQLNSAKTDILRAKQSYDTGLYALSALLGVSGGEFPKALRLATFQPETTKEMKSPNLKTLMDYAKNHRPDMIQTRILLEQTKANVGTVKAGYYPTISLSGALSGDREDNGQFEQDDFGRSLSLNLSYNLYSGGLKKARVHEARLKVIEAEKGLTSLENQINSEVLTSGTEVKSAQERLILQRTNANLVQKNRDLVEKIYDAGQGSLVSLNEAQRNLIAAQSRLALALVSLRQAWYSLETDTGRVLERFE